MNVYAMAGNAATNTHDKLGLALPLAYPVGVVVWEGLCSAAAATAAFFTSAEVVAAVGTVAVVGTTAYVVNQSPDSATTCPRCEVRAITQEQAAVRNPCRLISGEFSGFAKNCIYECAGGVTKRFFKYDGNCPQEVSEDHQEPGNEMSAGIEFDSGFIFDSGGSTPW